MTIQATVAGATQALRTDFQDAALGQIGNLAFRGQPGSTPRASTPNFLQRIGSQISAAISHVGASPAQRADRQVMSAARAMSTDAGNLLGQLTGRRDADSTRRSAGAVQQLIDRAANLPAGGSALTQAQPALTRHLEHLSTADLTALRGGPLADASSRAAVLAQLPPQSQAAATEILDHLAAAVDRQISLLATAEPVTALGAAFKQAAELGGIDAQKLDAALEQLQASAGMLKPDGQTLHHFFGPAISRLSDGQLANMARGMSVTPGVGGASTFDALKVTAHNFSGSAGAGASRQTQLDALQQAVSTEVQARQSRAQAPAVAAFQERLAGGVDADAASNAFDNLKSSLSDAMTRVGGQHVSTFPSDTTVMRAVAATINGLPPAHADKLLASLPGSALAQVRNAAVSLDGADRTSLQQAVGHAYDTGVAERLATVDGHRAQISLAVAREDHGGAATALLELSGAVDSLRVYQHAMGDEVAADTQSDLRETVAEALTLLRAPGNPDGPLNAATLSGLTGQEFGALRSARGELGDYGLTFDRAAVAAEVGIRTADARASAQTHGASMLALAATGGDPAALVGHLHGVADAMAAEMGQLQSLGEEIGADDIARIGTRTAHAMLEAMRADGGTQDLAAHFDEQLGALSMALPQLRVVLAHEMAMTDHAGDLEAMTRTSGTLAAAVEVLGAIYAELAQAHPDMAVRDTDVIDLSAPQRDAIAGYFGVITDAAAERATPLLSGDARDAIEASLTAPPSGEGTQTMTLPVNGVPTELVADGQFFLDAVDRTVVSFDVSGRGADGTRLHAGIPPGLSDDTRRGVLGNALSTLHQVAGPAAEPLTRFMTQQMLGGVTTAMALQGADSPLLLPNGDPFLPGGGGRVHCDITRLPDGQFSVGVTMTFSGMTSGTAMPVGGNPYAVQFDLANSPAEARFGVLVSADGSSITMSDPLRMHYRLTQVPIEEN